MKRAISLDAVREFWNGFWTTPDIQCLRDIWQQGECLHLSVSSVSGCLTRAHGVKKFQNLMMGDGDDDDSDDDGDDDG